MKKLFFLLLITTSLTYFFHEKLYSMSSSEKFDKKTNFKWIEDRTLAGMRAPKTREDIAELVARNIGLIVTLTTDTLVANYFGIEGFYFSPGQLPKGLTTNFDIETLYLPIAPNQPPTIDQIDKFLAAFENAQSKGKAVVVHCEYGKGRTNTMLACWLIAKKNYTAEQALTSIGYQHRENKILSYEQLNFVYIYENHLKNPRITIPDSVPDKPVAQPQSSPLSCLFTRLKHLIK